jgi:DNA polymerase I
MKQPQKIPKPQEINTLLVDGNCLLKKSITGAKDMFNSKGVQVGGIYQFIVQLRLLLKTKEWDYVYVFWDGDLSGRLRFELLPEYKSNRDKAYSDMGNELKDYVSKNLSKDGIDNRKEFKRQRVRVHKYLEELFIRQIIDKEVEADDMIAYYVNNKLPNEFITIVTSDKDLFQLLREGVSIYDLTKKTLVLSFMFKQMYGYHHKNIVLKKILCGDNSDNIKGVKGLGEKTLFELFPEIKTRECNINEIIEKVKQTINERVENKQTNLKVLHNIVNQITTGSQGDKLFEINNKIINLQNPLITDDIKNELDNTMYAPINPNNRGVENLYRLMIEDDLYNLFNDTKFVDFLIPFKKYINTEIKRYNNYLNI